mmetsp:Transcript_30322/g.43385  ORF Transcript_30322/g.43385 Transcript_30322/m.43385 type:complete len:199 (-) Transcript_30322:3136-3732(-)
MGSASSIISPLIHETVDIKSSLPFPKHGVKLSYYLEFMEKCCGGGDNLIGLTTQEVCDKFVKPITFEYQCSFCEWLEMTEHPAVGVATVFISHAWKFKFTSVVDALQYHFSEEQHKDIIIWFDLFSNNQHKATDLDFDWWCNTFKSAIHQFGYTVLVLSPWYNPIPLTRAWCLFEFTVPLSLTVSLQWQCVEVIKINF